MTTKAAMEIMLSKIRSPFSKPSVKVWVFGHAHCTTDFRDRGVRIVSNQRGYVLPWSDSADVKNGFDVRKVIHM
jgi:hypothetical protein